MREAITILIFFASVISGIAISTKGIPVEHAKGINGLDKIVLRESGGRSAEVYLYGAHLTSWKNEQGKELIFLSTKSNFQPPKPIRGGIPLCFPQFSNLGPLDSHGFARNRIWSIDSNPPPLPSKSTSKAFTDLILRPSEGDLKIWPHKFEYRLRVALGPKGDLTLTSRIKNTDTDGKPFNFTFAYHTYFSVPDISNVRVDGLKALDYLDNLQNRTRFTEQENAITFESAVDRIYLRTPKKIAVLDHKEKKSFLIQKEGLSDAVVWNPRDKKISDLNAEDYKHFVCVEAAAIEKPINLKPGEEWTGRLALSAIPK